jgi:hypothetical protein
MQTVEEHLEYGVMQQAYELMHKHQVGDVTDATLYYGLNALLTATRYWLSKPVIEAIETPLKKFKGLPFDVLLTVAYNEHDAFHILRETQSGDFRVMRPHMGARTHARASEHANPELLMERFVETSKRVMANQERFTDSFTNYTHGITA